MYSRVVGTHHTHKPKYIPYISCAMLCLCMSSCCPHKCQCTITSLTPSMPFIHDNDHRGGARKMAKRPPHTKIVLARRFGKARYLSCCRINSAEYFVDRLRITRTRYRMNDDDFIWWLISIWYAFGWCMVRRHETALRWLPECDWSNDNFG